MSYQKLCEHNRHLFAVLEGLTNQISFCIANNTETDLEPLKLQKEAIRSMIDDNLHKIEDIWQVQALRANNTAQDVQIPSAKEKRVIGLYLQSENNSIKTVSEASGENEFAVGRIISRFLANGYNMAG